MKDLLIISVVAVASVALAGCAQDATRNNEASTDVSATADGTMSGDAVETSKSTGISIMQEPDPVAVPLLDPTVPPSTDNTREETKQLDNVLEQPAETVRDTPQ